jgi:hypothetical protein
VNGRPLLRFLPFPRARGEKAIEGTQDDGPVKDRPAVTPEVILPLGLAISCVAHLAFLTPALILAGGSPFDTRPADAIMVDIVSPEEVPQPADSSPAETAAGETASAPAAPPPAAAASQTATASPALPRPDPRPTRQRQPPATPQAVATPQSMPSPPSFVPQPQPAPLQPDAQDESNAGGMFGMPLTMPDGTIGGRFDAQAVDRADITNDAVVAFRNHLKTCSKLPAGVAPEVVVVVRTYLKPDGTLAAGVPDGNPQIIKVDGISKGGGPLSVNALTALRKCQPYKMLPPDRYEEWKMLDLTFTPQNF